MEHEILYLHRGLNFWPGGIKLSELEIYIQCAREGTKPQQAAFLWEHLSIRGFLSGLKHSKRAARAQGRQEARDAVMASATRDKRYRPVAPFPPRLATPLASHGTSGPSNRERKRRAGQPPHDRPGGRKVG